MRKTRALFTGLGLGAGWMYYADPQVGRRRRAMLRDKAVGEIRSVNCWLNKAVRDMGHRIEGTIAELQNMFDASVPSDEQIVDRVRAKLGHVASHARMIEVHASQGHVTLEGQAPADEIDCICSCVSAVRGVRSVDNRLTHQANLEAMHNGRARRRAPSSMDIARDAWAPGTRLAVGGLGGMLMLNCLARRTPKAILLGTLGFGLMARAAGNRDLGHLIEEGADGARPIWDRMSGGTQSHRKADRMMMHSR